MAFVGCTKMVEKNIAIENKETLEKVLSNLNEKKDFIINIPGTYTTELLMLFKNHSINCSRVGFKRWSLFPSSKPIDTSVKTNISLVVFRGFCLISAFYLFFTFIIWGLSPFWLFFESHFISLPVAAGMIGTAIMTLILVPLKIIFNKKPRTLLKIYLGIDR